MAEIVNLRGVRKAKTRAIDADEAAANRLKFGRTKAEKAFQKAEDERLKRGHDQSKLDAEDETT